MTEERRLVTILFADVVGSTALGESMDPEDVRALLGRLFSIARESVEEYGGRVEKFIGDAIMAVFGLPIVHDDDPARALAAALALRDRVRADPALGDRLPIRLGVNSGEVIAARDPTASEFMVTGDAVNTAARLQQGGDAWTILVGDRTANAAGPDFAFGEPIEIEAKGKATPVSARILLGRVTSPARRTHQTRLVGRESDLLQLELAARRAIEEGRPYLVNIVAPAGVGKSRLLEEFLERLPAASPTPPRVAIAQCLPYGQRLTYWPMRAILLAILGLDEEAAPEALRERLGTWLTTNGDPEPERTADLVAATVGAGDLENSDQISLFGAWKRFVELAAAEAPLVLIVEDLHWSSDSLLDLIEAILQPRADVPLLMIALARPELLDRRPSWGGGRRNSISIALEPLRDAAVEELVQSLLEQPSAEIVSAVVQRAEGNPFYAGEIVRSLVDRLGPSPTREAVDRAIASLPDTVQTTVLARLDALDPPARRVIQLGSVLGRSLQPAAISVLEPELTPAAVDAAIETLVERDLLRPTGAGTLSFRHILIREVAYGTLPRAERIRLHSAAGRWLEERAIQTGREDELAELVAFHLREAATLGALVGEPAAPDLARAAVGWLRRAADVAVIAAATVEAARHLQAAIELAPADASPELHEALGDAWISGDQAGEAYRQAHEMGRQLGLDPDQQLRTFAKRTIVQTRWIGSVSKRYPDVELRETGVELDTMTAASTDERSRAIGFVARGFVAGVITAPTPDDVARSEVAARRALELAEGLGDTGLQSAALDALSTVAMTDDRFEQVLGYVERRLALENLPAAEQFDAMIVVAWSNYLLGHIDVTERAASRIREGLAPGQAAGYALGASGWRTLALRALGRWDEALAEAGRGEIAWRESEILSAGYALNGFLAARAICQARRDAVGADHWRSAVETILDRMDPAARMQGARYLLNDDLPGLTEATVVNYRVFFGRLDWTYAALEYLIDRRHPIAEAILRDLARYSADRGLALLEAHVARGIGVVLGEEEALRAALSGYEAIGARPLAARAKTELGVHTRDPALISAGAAELERLGDVEQLERVLAEARSSGVPSAS